MKLTIFPIRDIIHGVARSQHQFIIISWELGGSHAAFSLRWWAGIIEIRIFVLPLRWAGTLLLSTFLLLPPL
jgi:hypothetical protein